VNLEPRGRTPFKWNWRKLFGSKKKVAKGQKESTDLMSDGTCIITHDLNPQPFTFRRESYGIS